MEKQRRVAVAVMTLDGKIGLDERHFTDWSSREDKRFLREFLKEAGVIVVGHNTHEIAARELARYNRIVLSTSIASVERRDDKLVLCNPETGGIEELLKPYATVAVLGGTNTYTYFLERGLLDEIYLTIEPLVFGRGLDLFASAKNLGARFRLVSIERLNESGSVLLRYAVCRGGDSNSQPLARTSS